MHEEKQINLQIQLSNSTNAINSCSEPIEENDENFLQGTTDYQKVVELLNSPKFKESQSQLTFEEFLEELHCSLLSNKRKFL